MEIVKAAPVPEPQAPAAPTPQERIRLCNEAVAEALRKNGCKLYPHADIEPVGVYGEIQQRISVRIRPIEEA